MFLDLSIENPNLIKKLLYSEIILNLHNGYKDNTELLYTLDPVFSPVSILHNYRTLIKTKKLILVDYFEAKCRISLELPRFCMNVFFFFSVSESHPGFHTIFHCHILTPICVCLSSSLLSGSKKYLSLILCFPCLSLRISHFSKEY